MAGFLSLEKALLDVIGAPVTGYPFQDPSSPRRIRGHPSQIYRFDQEPSC